MLDIKFIRENKEELQKAVHNKNLSLDIEELLTADQERVRLLQEIEELQAQKNQVNESIKKAQNNEERQEAIQKGTSIKQELEILEPKYKEVKRKYDELMVQVPNIPAEDVPVGKSENENVEVDQWGDKPEFTFTPKTHIEIGKDLDILDLEKGAKVGGYRGYYLKNEGTLLVMGVMMYALGKMVEKGFSPMIPPTLVKEFSLFGTGYFKGLQYDGETDEIYQVATSDKEVDGKVSKDKKFLVGTAEPSLLAYYADEVLDEEDLPIKVSGYSQCYRSEIGSYGKETKGMYRVHEFMKIEQVVLAPADKEKAEEFQKEMISISEEMHKELGLPFRKLAICTGDLSAGKYKQYDLEAWMPGLNRWGETGSASNFLDWQSRRLNVKYKDAEGNKKYVYMLNNTALPTPRIFIAILENYQQEDGSVKVPEALRTYVGKNVIEKR